MPYINREDRHKYQDLLHKISNGVANYIDNDISKFKSELGKSFVQLRIRSVKYSFMYFIITDLIDSVWGPVEKRRYADHQNISGYLYCAGLEYHRRYVKKDINTDSYPSPFLVSMSSISGYITELGNMVPKDAMAISGNMNYITSYLIDEIWGQLENRTDEDHFYIENLLEDKAKIYYTVFTAPYEDKKISEQGDLRDL